MADPQKPKPPAPQPPAPTPAPPQDPPVQDQPSTDPDPEGTDTEGSEGGPQDPAPTPAPPAPSGAPERVRRASPPRAAKPKAEEHARETVKLNPNELLVYNFENKTEFRVGKQIFAGMAADTYGLGDDAKPKYKVLQGNPLPAKPGNVRSDRRRDDPEGDE